MQTMAVQIQDDYVQKFMSYVNSYSDSITIEKDKSLELDPYFYVRQKELHQPREDIKNGDMEMLSQEQYDKEMKQFFSDLKK
jgi:hypothetical protein